MNAISTPAPVGNRVRAKDLAERYDVTESYIYQLAKKGKIPSIKIGKVVRFDLAAVIAQIEGAPAAAANVGGAA